MEFDWRYCRRDADPPKNESERASASLSSLDSRRDVNVGNSLCSEFIDEDLVSGRGS